MFPNPGDARGLALVAQPDGKPVTAGYREGESPLAKRMMGLARLRADGRFDASFDGDGKRLLDELHGHDTAYAIVRQPDGALVVSRRRCRLISTRTSCPGWTFVLVRLRPNGTLDKLVRYRRVRDNAVPRRVARRRARLRPGPAERRRAWSPPAPRPPATPSDFALARYLSGTRSDADRDADRHARHAHRHPHPDQQHDPAHGHTDPHAPRGSDRNPDPHASADPHPHLRSRDAADLSCHAPHRCGDSMYRRVFRRRGRVADINPAPPPCASDHQPARISPPADPRRQRSPSSSSTTATPASSSGTPMGRRPAPGW